MKKFLPQEALKLIACITMLIDHTAAVFLPWDQAMPWRIVGRLAFPIYCFLLAEGAAHTRSPLKYALRLGSGVLLAEIPFDLLFYGGLTWKHSSVMVTLLLGLLAILAVQKLPSVWLKVPAVILCVLLAEELGTDYGGLGVLLVLGMYLCRESKYGVWPCGILLTGICWAFDSAEINIFGAAVSIQLFAVLAMIPICMYSGKKLTGNRWLQWGFYLFYPVHIALLLLITKLL